MAGGAYRVTYLSTKEGEEKKGSETLTEFQLLEKFAPELKPGKPSQSKLRREWVQAFTTIDALPASVGIKLERLDSKKLFADRLKAFEAAETEFVKSKRELHEAALGAISDTTAEEIAEGEVHSVTKSGNTKVGIIEYYIRKSKAAIKDVLEKTEGSVSEDVQKALDALSEKRAGEAEGRKGKPKPATDA